MLNRLRRIASNWKTIWKGKNYCKRCEEKNKLDAFEKELDEFVTEKLKENDFLSLQEKLGDMFVPVMIRRGEFSRLYWCMNEKDLSHVSMEHGMYSRVIDIRMAIESKPRKYGPRRELGLFGTSDYSPLFRVKKRNKSYWAISGPLPKPIMDRELEAILVVEDEPVLSVNKHPDRQQILKMMTKCYQSKEIEDGISQSISKESSSGQNAGESPEESG